MHSNKSLNTALFTGIENKIKLHLIKSTSFDPIGLQQQLPVHYPWLAEKHSHLLHFTIS